MSRFGSASGALLLLLQSCSPEPTERPQDPPAPITNRIPVPPGVADNLGITFEPATRGRLGVWHEVPGQLEVPESRRWIVRAPARARVVSIAPRWHVLERGAEIATLESPALQAGQRAIDLAQRTLARASEEVVAARARLVESEAHLQEAASFEQASRQRLDALLALERQGNPLTAGESIDARRSVTEAGKARLDAAIARDELAARVAAKQIEADQAKLLVDESLSALAVLTGTPVEHLHLQDEAGPAWRRIERLALRAPAAGTIVDVRAAPGEIVDAGAPILELIDNRELRFRGRLPEGDLGTLAAGSRVRLEFPSRRLQAIETKLGAPLPIADATTRMIHVEAIVPNESGVLAHGMSVTAQVLVEQSDDEEVLIPVRCVVLDGLQSIVFKRDPNDPNVVIRTPVELGARAAGRVEVLAGVLDGDAVVAEGVQQLKRSGLGKAPEGGHFHADGTWHSDHK